MSLDQLVDQLIGALAQQKQEITRARDAVTSRRGAVAEGESPDLPVALLAALPSTGVDLYVRHLTTVKSTMVNAAHFVASPVAGFLEAVPQAVIPVLAINGIATDCDPDDETRIGWILDWLFRSNGTGARTYLSSLIDGRRATLSTPSERPQKPPSEPGVDVPPVPQTAVRTAELDALDRLTQTVGRAWAGLYARIGPMLERVEAHAREVMTVEIAKARELAAYKTVGLAADKNAAIVVADQPLFHRFGDAMRSLAVRRANIRRAETHRTLSEVELLVVSFAALLALLKGSSPRQVSGDPLMLAAQDVGDPRGTQNQRLRGSLRNGVGEHRRHVSTCLAA